MEQPALLEALTERELDIARLIAEGLSNHEIAAQLVLTHGTVKWYCGQIYSKLGVSTRPQAIRQIQTLKLFEQTPASPPVRATSFLPIPPGTLIGREREMAQIHQLLAQHRLITLDGSGWHGQDPPGAGSGCEGGRSVSRWSDLH